MIKNYDVIIVGGGPAGIFAALELSNSPKLRILMIEKGKDIDQRSNLVSGLGGAGAFSDGKLTLSSQIGGHLSEYLGQREADTLIDYVDSVYLKFGAQKMLFGISKEVEEISYQASLAHLKLTPVQLRHLGTDHSRSVLKAMRDYLFPRLDLKLESMAISITTDNKGGHGVLTDTGEKFYCNYLILAPGREGADWLSKEAKRLNLTMHINPVDIGIRVEVPAIIMKRLTGILYEAKLEFLSHQFEDRIRTFCMCPEGEVITESTGGDDPVITVNGHSYKDRYSKNTNFALLVSTTFTEPFQEPIAYGKYLAKLANLISGGVLVQRFGDLMQGRRSNFSRIKQGLVCPTLTSATPGDLSFVLPYRYLTGIIEMLQAMDKLTPGVASPHTLLYGVEVKFYSWRLQLNPNFETEIRNIFAAGDGAGISRGLIQASASGVAIAREIIKRN